jgi:hypothetical protein
MIRRMCPRLSVLVFLLLAAGAAIEAIGKVDGTFIVGGSDAKLRYVRATRTKLDEKGRTGFAILLSAREAAGDIASWKTADPSARGSFIYLQLEQNGAVWSAELGHAAAKSGRFGVVTEVKTSGFRVQADQIVVTLRTDGEQEFTKDRYTVDLKIDATIER